MNLCWWLRRCSQLVTACEGQGVIAPSTASRAKEAREAAKCHTELSASLGVPLSSLTPRGAHSFSSSLFDGMDATGS